MTPMQALHHLLHATGYCKSKLDLARLLNIKQGNIYAYLAPPDPREDNDIDHQEERNRSRISPRPGTLHGWCWGIGQVTGLLIEIRLCSDGSLELHVSGTAKDGQPIEPIHYKTVYRSYDFPEPLAWLSLPTARRRYAITANHRTQALAAEQVTTGRSKAATVRERKRLDKTLEQLRERLTELLDKPSLISLDTELGLVEA
jgi:hypothetical protein